MKPKKKWYETLLNILLVFAIVICVAVISFKSTLVGVVVSGTSMNPTIIDGSSGYMQKVHKNTKLERFDVVASKYNSKDSEYVIKRILGLPNEQVSLMNNVLLINGNVITQDFNFTHQEKDYLNNSWILKENEYLLVGDNRPHSIEPLIVSKESIFGKNGMAIKTYDVNNKACSNTTDKTSCPILNRKWYHFKDGK